MASKKRVRIFAGPNGSEKAVYSGGFNKKLRKKQVSSSMQTKLN